MTLPDFIQIPSILILDKNLQQLDWLVYGVIYWFTKLKLEKCILTNSQIAEMLNSSSGSIANSISRLAEHKYVKVIIENYARKEIVPLVFFKHEGVHPQVGGGSSTDEGGSSTDETKEDNIIRELNNNKKENTVLVKEKVVRRKDKTVHLTDLVFFTNMAPNTVWELSQKFGISEDRVKQEAEKAVDWIKSKGNGYTDYMAFFRNWLRNCQKWDKKETDVPKKRFALEDFEKYKGMDAKADRESKEWLANNRPEQFLEVVGIDAQTYLSSLTPS